MRLVSGWSVVQRFPAPVDAGAMIGLCEDDIRRDQEGRAPRGRAGLMDTGAEGLAGWAAKRAAQQDG